MHLVFDDHDTRILRSVHDEFVRAMQDDIVTVARIECHQRITTAKCPGPSWENISKLEFSIVGDGIEIVVAIDKASQTLLNDVEEGVERRKGRVLEIDIRIVSKTQFLQTCAGWLTIFPGRIELSPLLRAQNRTPAAFAVLF